MIHSIGLAFAANCLVFFLMDQMDNSKAQDDGQKSSEDIISRQLTYSRKEFRIRICGGGSNGKQSIPCDTALLGFRLSQQDLKVIVDIVNPGQRHAPVGSTADNHL